MAHDASGHWHCRAHCEPAPAALGAHGKGGQEGALAGCCALGEPGQAHMPRDWRSFQPERPVAVSGLQVAGPRRPAGRTALASVMHLAPDIQRPQRRAFDLPQSNRKDRVLERLCGACSDARTRRASSGRLQLKFAACSCRGRCSRSSLPALTALGVPEASAGLMGASFSAPSCTGPGAI